MAIQKPVLSATQLGTLFNCGTLYEFVYVDGLRKPPSTSMIRGRGPHRARECSLNHLLEEEELLSVPDVKDVAADQVEKDFSEEVAFDEEEKEEGEEKVKGRIKDMAVTLSAHDRVTVQKKITPVEEGVERKVFVPLKDFPYDLMGVIDVIDDHGTELDPEFEASEERPSKLHVVRDLKTGVKSKSQRDADNSDQLTLYHILHKVEFGFPPVGLALDAMISLKRGPKDQTIPTTRDAWSIQRFVNRLEQAAKVIESGAFTPAPPDYWKCSPRFCGFWDECPYGGKGRKRPRS